MLTPAVLGSRLRAELTALAALYQPMMASETVEEWAAWPLARWQRLWTGLEAARVLDELGRRAMGLKGCPFGARGCPANAPMCCAVCAGLDKPKQGAML